MYVLYLLLNIRNILNLNFLCLKNFVLNKYYSPHFVYFLYNAQISSILSNMYPNFFFSIYLPVDTIFDSKLYWLSILISNKDQFWEHGKWLKWFFDENKSFFVLVAYFLSHIRRKKVDTPHSLWIDRFFGSVLFVNILWDCKFLLS